jgi:diphosphomevalonate decarboxylase
MEATARARANIALVKYWGKADERLKIPAVGSISITLDRLWTQTSVRFDARLAADELELDGAPRPDKLPRVSACLDLLRRRAGVSTRARVVSHNNFPTGAGLASSASGFAALVGAAASALGVDASARELSILARRGSGSAARSIFGGFVEMHRGSDPDGSDSFAEPLLGPEAWPLDVVVAIAARGEKDVGSGEGMARSEQSSPYYPSWVRDQPHDLEAARQAILERDFERLADVSEHSCLKMHAAALAARPALVYWKGVTLECLHATRSLRRAGVPVFFTIDAGPQLKAVCLPQARDEVAAELSGVPGVLEVVTTGLGPGLETQRR